MSSTPATLDTLMWEARARPGCLGGLLRWVEDRLLPALLADAGGGKIDVYSDEHDRAVVILSRTDGLEVRGAPGALEALPAPPPDLLERPAHQWPFRHWRSQSSSAE